MQPNCSFCILCLFSVCQNSRAYNQGRALDGVGRQISLYCRPSLPCGCSFDATEVYFPPCCLVSEDGRECNFELKEICIWCFCNYSHYYVGYYLPSVNRICVWADSSWFDLNWAWLSWITSTILILSGIFLATKEPPLSFSANCSAVLSLHLG